MKKSRLLGTVFAGLLAITSTVTYSATYDVAGTLTVRDPAGAVAGSIDNDVTGIYNDSGTTSLSLDPSQPFFGFLWSSTGSVYGAGTWAFEACLADGSTQCTPPAPISMTVGTNQWGGHLLTDWNIAQNFDVLNVWDVTSNSSGTILLSATDPDGDGILGIPLVDGPFIGYSWSYDLVLTPQAIPIPPALWLFGSGLLGFFGVARNKKAA